jgi:hypothetical protein
MMAAIIQPAVERGEIDPRRLSPRIASLPLDLARHDLITKRAPVKSARRQLVPRDRHGCGYVAQHGQNGLMYLRQADRAASMDRALPPFTVETLA